MKNINTAIAVINTFAAVGTCGALECGTISLGTAFVRCLVFGAIALIAGRAASRAARREAADMRRAAARAARRAAMSSREVSARRIESVRLARR